MKKRTLALLLVCVLITGCGNSAAAPKEANNSPAPAAAEETTTKTEAAKEAEETPPADPAAADPTAASEPTATTATIEAAGLTSEDLQAAAEVYKFTGGNDTDETRLRLLKFSTAAAALGNGTCMMYIGELYQAMNVAGVEGAASIEKAVEWWEMAGEHGESTGYADIGLLYLHKNIPGGGSEYGDIPYDFDKAMEYLEKANEMNDVKAPRYIGILYRDGEGVDQDEAKAYEYFQIAADRNDTTSIVYCAEYLLEGRGVEQDVEGAIALYQGIIDSDGHDTPKAAYAIGKMYEEGTYLEKDPEKAVEYYEIVVEKAFSADSQEALEGAKAGLERLQ